MRLEPPTNTSIFEGRGPQEQGPTLQNKASVPGFQIMVVNPPSQQFFEVSDGWVWMRFLDSNPLVC